MGNDGDSRQKYCFKWVFFETIHFNQKKIGQFSGPAAAPEKGEVIWIDPRDDRPRKGPWYAFFEKYQETRYNRLFLRKGQLYPFSWVRIPGNIQPGRQPGGTWQIHKRHGTIFI
jgi:hypothetical protein